MREMKIKEIDSGCYVITTTDFQDSDSVEYHWDQISRSFWGEYQYATLEKRRFQRDTFSFEENSTIGRAIDFIWRRDSELSNERFKARIARSRPRQVDRIVV